MIPAHTIDAIKRATSLPALVQESRPLRKQGGRYIGWCPFCAKPRTPAFAVYSDHYFCHRCERTGSSFDWLKEMAGMTFSEAANELAARAGISLVSKPLSPVERASDVEDARMFPWWVEEQQALVRRALDAALVNGPPDNREDYEYCCSLGRLLRHKWTVQEFRLLVRSQERRAWRMDVAWDESFRREWMRLAEMVVERVAA